ncbi:ABC transporter ATP-binding protein [Lysinibacillus sphaericus]|uniref:Glycerol-3-phosphate ABC transporter ATP-binding protein n=2 Tax=Lysinibacillus TaxID=400634 RepID=A0A2S0K1T6_LYSSH|nr:MULTISPECIES: ABC transporter ATP-binding protein [Lysinibacillus]AVK97306.1 sugar ABC transporter ATP-binding protein [Lysinibacillus sphaericus]MED4542610.1 ABC transporter ATP-binding protein [Lysinibacillus sphaericus]TKI20006.1 ABC transporter ATP-binding protein [Lysinibacillus sphaericus]TKI47680.1 ABC transporter ATP-binding protein [Lysinibacillus tabacifolii]SUV16800.1 glycerol-3-phosphate ABC transporter ATP-binding protein [Lysinibacillus sphaericus]
MKEIQFEDVKKNYGQTEVVKGLNLTIEKGERLILLGPSGCGKSTTLRLIAGLEDISSGKLIMDGKVVNNIPSGKRNVAMVFQNYALYPHMTVKQNITYALRMKKIPKKEIELRLEDALKMLQLNGLEERLPKDLSGGQRQRVALARAIVKRADYFLLDEPLSNLDAQLRVSARKELVNIHEKYKQTIVYVTHDQIEAMTVGHRIALLNEGVLQMLDTPENVYHHPSNIFTAKFIGAPPTNILTMKYQDGNIHFGTQSFSLSPEWVKKVYEAASTQLVFGIRPEHIDLSTEPQVLHATVKSIENLGAEYAVYLTFNNEEMIALSSHKNWPLNQQVYVRFKMEHIHLFDKATTNSIGYPIAYKNKSITLN